MHNTECARCHWIVHFKIVHCTSGESHRILEKKRQKEKKEEEKKEEEDGEGRQKSSREIFCCGQLALIPLVAPVKPTPQGHCMGREKALECLFSNAHQSLMRAAFGAGCVFIFQHSGQPCMGSAWGEVCNLGIWNFQVLSSYCVPGIPCLTPQVTGCTAHARLEGGSRPH